MAPNLLSLRSIPRRFHSVLFPERDGREATWVLNTEGFGRHPREISAPRSGVKMTGTTLFSHSADRLAKAIVLATTSPADPRTLNAWGQQVGVSRGALRVWCKAANVSARSCLDFVRVLRAVMLSQNQAWDLPSILDVVDKRSLFQLLDRGGVRELCREQAPSVGEFITAQRFLGNEQVLEAISRRLMVTPLA